MAASKDSGGPLAVVAISSGGSVGDGDDGAVVVVLATAIVVVTERWRVTTVRAQLAAVAQWREQRRRQ